MIQDSARSQEPLHGLRSSRASAGLQTPGVKCDQARDKTCSHAGDLTMKETRSNRDPCWDRAWMMLATDPEFPTFLFRPPSARQLRREKSGNGPSNPRSREEPFLDPPDPRPAFGRPGSPEKDCGPGCQSRNRPELSMPRTQVPRFVHGSGLLGNHGARPRRDGLGRPTPAEYSRLLYSDARPTCQGRRSGDP